MVNIMFFFFYQSYPLKFQHIEKITELVLQISRVGQDEFVRAVPELNVADKAPQKHLRKPWLVDLQKLDGPTSHSQLTNYLPN